MTTEAWNSLDDLRQGENHPNMFEEMTTPPAEQASHENTVLHMSHDELIEEYKRVFNQNPQYFVDGGDEKIIQALLSPEWEINRITKILVEEAASERGINHAP